ncbi:MAG: Ig-like domain-containing protein [Treponema sp.]|nr:Ig-like domain-containing protein [Treponema sp.]
MMSRFGLTLAGCMLLAVLMAGCETEANSVGVTGVYINQGNQPAPQVIDLYLDPADGDGTVALTAVVEPSNADNKNVSWSSSHPARATVTNNGLVTAAGVGQAQITVTTADGSFTASVDINVHGQSVETEPGDPSEYAGTLLILQAAGTAGGEVGRSFVELYNNSSAAINLDGFSLQHAGGTGAWSVIPLEGTIPANSSFLILGNRGSAGNWRLDIPDTDGDMVVNFTLSNRAFRVAIMESLDTLSVPNPSDMSITTGADMRSHMPPDGTACTRTIGNTVAAGLVDLLGVVNERADDRDVMHGAEATPAFRISNQVAIRRAGLTDTNNNFNDFILIDYRVWSAGDPYRLTNEQVPIFMPRSSNFQPRNVQFPEPGNTPDPIEPGDETKTLMILQANTYGNANNSTTGSGLPASAVELYNNSDSAINFDVEDYYLHIGGRPSAGVYEWHHAIKLTGTVQPGHSFLIVSTTDISTNIHRAKLPTADVASDFVIPNDRFTIVIMKNRATLPAGNPFGNAELANDYVDMFGVGDTIGFEGTAFSNQSRPRVPRRASLADTDNNANDFTDIDYRSSSTTAPSDDDLHKVWPRSATMGAWDPMTGLPRIDPAPRD